ncbi:hypothetical protein KY338_04160 [Candidatus Woesearchaeota archaeon]|nr:hypothetical protein [Candidatus Woesearchaeota archaeon]MBW3005825.1 hypothetical protein [Candidatus Woesearchaeota archaeon]
MGRLVDVYKIHTRNNLIKTEFEQEYKITKPQIIEGRPPSIIAEAPLKIKYCAPEKAKEQGLDQARITADMTFKDALGLFLILAETVHQNKHFFLTEPNFINEKLISLGMQLVTTGNRGTPSLFSLTPELFREFAEKDFYIEGIYHGKPYEIRIVNDARHGIMPLQMTRSTDEFSKNHIDRYTLQDTIIAKPEEIEQHLTRLEEALHAWEEKVRIKRAKQDSPGWLE